MLSVRLSNLCAMCGTVLPPGAAERPIWEEGSAPRPDKEVTTKKIIHTRLWRVVLFTCIRYTYPYSKGRLSFKMIPMYPWVGGTKSDGEERPFPESVAMSPAEGSSL